MLRFAISFILLLVMTQTSFSQTKSVSIHLISNLDDSTSLRYDKIVKDYLLQHIKKSTSVTVKEFPISVSKQVQDDMSRNGGDFIDSTLTAKAKANGISYLMLVYYDTNPFEKQKTVSGKKQISYGCRTNIYIQVINTATNQVLNRKHYNGSAGTAIMGDDNFKTREQAIKASLDNSTADFTDDIKSIDEFFKRTLL
jgi:hypothetical protein